MGKKGKKKASKVAEPENDEKKMPAKASVDEAAQNEQADREESDSDVSSEEDDGDDLVLEGVLVRNPEVSSSSSSDDDDDEEEDDEEEDDDKDQTHTNQNKRKRGEASARPDPKAKSSRKRKKPGSNKKKGPDILKVEFTFCDMNEKYFHGLKVLLQSSSTIFAPHSSALSDLMIENISVGTVISTEGDEEGNVFGFASILNVTTNGRAECVKSLKDSCLRNCPTEHKSEMETVLSGKTKRPAGFLLHSRMVNLPLEIVEVLHQQLVLDMDWAVKNAEGGEEERKSLDFGAFVRLAPATPDGSGLVYRYFEDEIFAQNAEFVYSIGAPKRFGSETKQLCSVIVMTKTGHRAAMKDLANLVNVSP